MSKLIILLILLIRLYVDVDDKNTTWQSFERILSNYINKNYPIFHVPESSGITFKSLLKRNYIKNFLRINSFEFYTLFLIKQLLIKFTFKIVLYKISSRSFKRFLYLIFGISSFNSLYFSAASFLYFSAFPSSPTL